MNTITTKAFINSGAQINAAANNDTIAGTNQNVPVLAGRSYNDLSIGAGVAGSGNSSRDLRNASHAAITK